MTRPGHCEGCVAENCRGTDVGNYGTLYKLAAEVVEAYAPPRPPAIQALDDFLSGKDEEMA